MKKMMTWGLALASLTFTATSCSDNKPAAETTSPIGTGAAADSSATSATPNDTTTTAPAGAMAYACPMHPEVVSNQPGKCPKCHMDLVKK